MIITTRQLKYIRWMQAQLEKYAGVEDETRRDLMEDVAGVRSAKELSPKGARELIKVLQKKLAEIGIKTTAKPRAKKRAKSARVGKRSAAQVNMIWTIAEARGMNEMELYAFLRKRITGGRTGNPAQLTNQEMTAAKKALEDMRDRGDVRGGPEKGAILAQQGNITKIQF